MKATIWASVTLSHYDNGIGVFDVQSTPQSDANIRFTGHLVLTEELAELTPAEGTEVLIELTMRTAS